MNESLIVDTSHLNFIPDTLVWSLAKQQQTSYRRLAHTSTQVGSYIFIVGGHNAIDYVSDLLMYNLGKIFLFFFIIVIIIILTFRLKFPCSMNPDSFSVNHHQIADTMQAFWQTVVYSFLEVSMVKSPLMMCIF